MTTAYRLSLPLFLVAADELGTYRGTRRRSAISLVAIWYLHPRLALSNGSRWARQTSDR